MKALSHNRVDSVARRVWFCSGTDGNEYCRKGSPCSTQAKGNKYPRPDRLRLREAALHSAPFREPFLPRPPDDSRSALPILALACVLRGKRGVRTSCLFPGGGGVAQSSLTLASPAVKGACFSLSTANLNRACLQASLRSAAGTAPAGRRSLRRYALVSGRQQKNRKPADASQRVNAHCSALINLFLSRRI